MVTLPYQFKHPFSGTVVIRRLECTVPDECHLHYQSDGLTSFAIPLPISQDGSYLVTLEWEHEGRLFSHQSNIRISTGQLIAQ